MLRYASWEVSCLADSATAHDILPAWRYQSNFIPPWRPTKALYSPCSERTLLSYKDIRLNNYDDDIAEENGKEYLCITSYLYGHERILEKMERLSHELYYTLIRSFKAHRAASMTLGHTM